MRAKYQRFILMSIKKDFSVPIAHFTFSFSIKKHLFNPLCELQIVILGKSERSFDQMVSYCARIELCSKKWRRIALKETEIYLFIYNAFLSLLYDIIGWKTTLNISFNTIKIEKSSVYAYSTVGNTIQRSCTVSYVFLSICCFNLNDNNKLQRSISRGVRTTLQRAWEFLFSKVHGRNCAQLAK